jgi:MFS family permease
MKSRLTLLLFFLAYVLSFVDRQIVAVVGAQIREAFSMGNLQIGLLYGTAFSVIYALAGIPMGWIADRWNRRNMIAAGLAIWSLMTVISGWASSFGFLIAARMILGLSQAMLSPAVYSWLADAYPADRRSEVFSLYASGIFIGVGLSFLIGGTVAQSADWRTAMIVVGAPGLLVAGVILACVREPERRHVRHGSLPRFSGFIGDLARILRVTSVRWHLLGFSALACSGYTILAFISIVLRERFEAPHLIPHTGWFLFGVAVMVVLSGRFADGLARRHPSLRYVSGLVSASATILYVAGLFVEHAASGFVLLGLGLLVGSSYNGVAAGLIQDYAAQSHRALAGGIYLFVISIAGFGLGPPAAGYLMDHVFIGPDAIAWSLSAVFAACGLIAVFSFLMAMRSHAADAANVAADAAADVVKPADAANAAATPI